MKNTRKLGAAFLACALFTLTINLNAAVAASITKVWDPESRLVVAHARIPFLQMEIRTGTDEPLDMLRVDRTGTSKFRDVFRRIVAVDGYGRVVAKTENEALDADSVFLRFENTVVQRENPMYLTIWGEAKDLPSDLSGESGNSVSLRVGEIRLGNILESTGIALDIRGAVHTVNASLFIGAFSGIYRTGGPENKTVGPSSILFSMRFNMASAEDISSLPTFVVRTTGGTASDISNMALVSFNGTQRIPMALVEGSVSGLTATFEPAEHVTFPKGGETFYIEGAIGNSFARGGTISISTTPTTWRNTYGKLYGYEIPVNGFGTVVGPTMTVIGPRLDVSVKAPSYSWVNAGQANLTVLTIVLDARESSEDIAVTGLPFWYITAPEWKNDVEKAGYFDGNSDLPGTGMFHGSASSEWVTAWSESYPEAIRVPKGTLKELQLKIDLAPTASGYYGFGILDTSNFRVTGTETGFNPTVNLRPGWHIIRASQGKG